VYRAICDGAILFAPASMGLAIQTAGFGAAESLNVSVAGIALVGVWLLYARRMRTTSLRFAPP
jgi:hypothetical protein